MAGHQIRAQFDNDTITVYQAYSKEIADAAIAAQRLSASPNFKLNRMTWIKPSWCWMMYRSGYSHKDKRQERILALRMKHEHFITLLREAQLAHYGSSKTTGVKVIVQWDPERGPRLEKFDYRSIQIGISGEIAGRWVEEWIYGIEDVTETAREMKRMIDEDLEVGVDELKGMGLMPDERVYEVPEDVARRLEMSESSI